MALPATNEELKRGLNVSSVAGNALDINVAYAGLIDLIKLGKSIRCSLIINRAKDKIQF